MAGIYGFGANFNRVIKVGGLNQTGNTRNTQQAKNKVAEINLSTNQLDGFVRSNNEVQEAKKKDDEPKQGGDGAKKGWGEKVGKFFENYGNALARNGAVDPGNLKTWDKSVGQAIASTTLGYDPFG